MAVKVRAATEDDIPALMEMGAALHAESPRYSTLSYNPDKVLFLIRHLIADPESGALVAEKDGTIVGMMGGYVAAHWFSDDLIASDYTFYVKPEHRRKGRAALMLVRAFEAWAAAKGAVNIVPGTSTQIDSEGTATFYEKLGYERSGFTFCKRIA